MPIYKKKSEENLSAANLLIESNMYTSSVHCSYYAGFQFSKYVLANCCKIEYDKQDKESKGADSHFYVYTKTGESLDKKDEHLSFLDYNNKFSKLKKLRKQADYSDMIIKENEARKAYQCANEIISILKTKFHIK